MQDEQAIPDGSNPAFEALHEGVQRWIWKRRWSELRDAQNQAISAILDGEDDVIIAAATAAGKTEAAFLPICSRLLNEPRAGIGALYIGPLKALINDQFSRLDELCEELLIPVHRWHGDVSAAAKQRLLREPSGILLITPESLEALFVLRGRELAGVFAGLEWVVVDEMHAYLASARGRQLQSLLGRLDLVLRKRVRRIGLSATLGDMSLAADYLRPGAGHRVQCIVSESGGRELQLQLRAYVESQETGERCARAISDDLYSMLRGHKNLVFANSRADVELYANHLRQLCEEQRVPQEFFPHHGSLSKELREELEVRLRESEAPTTGICTSTLELGVDLGHIHSVAQIGAPASVASLRQRLGRSGRRGAPAILRVFARARAEQAASTLIDQLQLELCQSIAALNLLLARWCEPPAPEQLHLSTLVHQTLSLIAQHGGVSARAAFRALVESGPFHSVDSSTFAALLRSMGAAELIEQSPDGDLLLGPEGERCVDHHTFYALFETPQEYQLFSAGRVLGTTAFDSSLMPGLQIVFAGRAWVVSTIDSAARRIELSPAASGEVPSFSGGSGAHVHEKLRSAMRELYEGSDEPAYLNGPARDLLRGARSAYERAGLRNGSIVESHAGCLLFLFAGDRVMNSVAALMTRADRQVACYGPAIQVQGVDFAELHDLIYDILQSPPGDASQLALAVRNRQSERFDWALDEDLSCRDYASSALDLEGALRALREAAE